MNTLRLPLRKKTILKKMKKKEKKKPQEK